MFEGSSGPKGKDFVDRNGDVVKELIEDLTASANDESSTESSNESFDQEEQGTKRNKNFVLKPFHFKLKRVEKTIFNRMHAYQWELFKTILLKYFQIWKN